MLAGFSMSDPRLWLGSIRKDSRFNRCCRNPSGKSVFAPSGTFELRSPSSQLLRSPEWPGMASTSGAVSTFTEGLKIGRRCPSFDFRKGFRRVPNGRCVNLRDSSEDEVDDEDDERDTRCLGVLVLGLAE